MPIKIFFLKMKESLVKWNWAVINLRTIFGNEPQEDETSLFYLILQHWTYLLACFELETQNIRAEGIMYGCLSSHWLIGIVYLTLEGVILDVCIWSSVWFLSLARWFFKTFTYWFLSFWLHWVFVAVLELLCSCGATGFSLWWLLLLWSAQAW